MTCNAESAIPLAAPGRNIRIAIIDDHEVVRVGTAQIIAREPGWIVCGEAVDQNSGMMLLRNEHPDVAIIDLRLSGGDGLELVKQAKESYPEVLLLVSSMHDEQLYAERCLNAGAKGYVNKQESAQTLIGAIRTVLQGKVYLSEVMTKMLVTRNAGGGRRAGFSPLELLSNRELEVFQMIGRGLSIKGIARELHLSPKTIEYHREHIKEKLHLPNSSALLQHATAWRPLT